MQQLASKLPWANALEVWKLNGTLKKRKSHRKAGAGTKNKPDTQTPDLAAADTEEQEQSQTVAAAESQTSTPDVETCTQNSEESATGARLLKFRVTCNRAGDNHSFSSNEAARDFGGAVQEFFNWKADMTKFDIEVGMLVFPRLIKREYHPFSQRKHCMLRGKCKA